MCKDVTSNKIAVLAGGWSDERDVSMSSGKEVRHALQEAGFSQVDLLDVAQDDFMERLMGGAYDVAFVAMHGKYGEDGCVQGLLEVLHIPYTFSGVLASALAMAKDVTKTVYERAGIPTAAGVTLMDGEEVSEERLDEIVEELGLPVFVKPASNGSSFGISHVLDRSSLREAVNKAALTGGHVLIEAAIVGEEITVPVIGNDKPRALPIIEVVTGADFYDEKVKYEPSELHHVIPARLSEDVAARASELAERAHVALGCRGCSRSDFIVAADGTPYILETNTIPGMTAASLLPDSARHAGIEFSELCKYFVELALEGTR
ncbi:MAG: D-alanine--D-alanine ligase [Coriobacteriales bacterium]|nr:D-alanine--D-alanine ligase [Coriobacteriales bacterium]